MNAAHTPPTRLVAEALLGQYRSALLWTSAVLLAGAAVAVAVDLEKTWWLSSGAAVKFWPLVVGITLVTVHLRSFVTNGITRRAFVAGAAVFGVGMAAALVALVMTGAALQTVMGHLIGHDGAGKPPAGDLVGWSGHALPLSLAYLVSGLLFGAVAYRSRSRWKIALCLPAMLPVIFTEVLLGLDDVGDGAPLLAYPVALASCLVVIGLGFVVARRVLGEVAILRTAEGPTTLG